MRETQKVYVRRKMREVYVGREDERQKQKDDLHSESSCGTENGTIGKRIFRKDKGKEYSREAGVGMESRRKREQECEIKVATSSSATAGAGTERMF